MIQQKDQSFQEFLAVIGFRGFLLFEHYLQFFEDATDHESIDLAVDTGLINEPNFTNINNPDIEETNDDTLQDPEKDTELSKENDS